VHLYVSYCGVMQLSLRGVASEVLHLSSSLLTTGMGQVLRDLARKRWMRTKR
jgi:hypothetical protein